MRFTFILRCIAVLTIILVALSVVLIRSVPIRPIKTYGVTFSARYAKDLGLDWQKTLISVLDDLFVRNVRLPAYWDEIESREGEYQFSDLDWQIREIGKRRGDVILAIGKKLPRWPECYEPTWLSAKTEHEKKEALLSYISATIEHYRENKTITKWQIENEPYLPFGECDSAPSKTLDSEIALVRSLDIRPIIITDSGELSLWIRAAHRSDVFGSTMYRSVHNKIFGNITYPLPPSFFRLKRAITELAVGKKPMIIVELQGEPWTQKALYEITVQEQYKFMSPEAFRGVLSYASRTGFDTFYLWGVEWWYWLKEKQNQPEIWNIAKEAIQSTQIR